MRHVRAVDDIGAEDTLRAAARIANVTSDRRAAEHLVAEIRIVAGDDFELELIRYEPGPAEPDMGLFDTLADILRKLDPEGTAVPLLMSGVTDGRFFSRLGIQTYGFLPMNLPPGFNFAQTIHAADERIPVEAIEFGTSGLYQLLQRFGGTE